MAENRDIEAGVVSHCARAGVRLATAESCTGGLIASRITDVPGASDVFYGGIIAYDNSVKTGLLGVPATLLAAEGAVSEPVAIAMARGAVAALNVSVAVAVTGIAGPGGGTPDKPVGTVCMAAVGPEAVLVRRMHFEGDRRAVKAQTADSALALILELLETL